MPPPRRQQLSIELLKSGPDQHPPSFSSSGRTAEGQVGWPARLPLPRGNSSNAAAPRRREGGCDELSICNFAPGRGTEVPENEAQLTTCLSVSSYQMGGTEVPENAISPSLIQAEAKLRGAFLYPARFEGVV
jgi:hypothetical protein